MKHGLTLKLLRKATLACIMLTVVEIFLLKLTSIRPFSRTKLEMIAAWTVVAIAWIVYLVDRIRQHRRSKKADARNRKEKDPC